MTSLRIAATLLACAFTSSVLSADTVPEKLLLWPEGAPGAMANAGEETVRVTEQGERVVSNVHRPSLTIYLPKAKAPTAAVIVVPGGGHRELWTDHEGHNVAKFLQAQGIAAFVLHYRLERAPDSTYKIEDHALADLRKAMEVVRGRGGAEWNIEPTKVGIMGFSAGGQLALLAAMRFDAVGGARPDFVALVYPGGWPDMKFDAHTPPMFLLSGSDDYPRVIEALTQIFTGLRAAKVPAELHFYDGVPHGFGLRASNQGPVTQWPGHFVEWLRVRNFH